MSQEPLSQEPIGEDLLERVNRLYDLEHDHLERLLVRDPLFADLLGRVARAEAAGLRQMEPDQAQALSEARRMLFTITFEAAFKMGFFYAHTHPLDEVAGFEG
jgi:hypothetical protein